jgi:hypothetical protein
VLLKSSICHILFFALGAGNVSVKSNACCWFQYLAACLPKDDIIDRCCPSVNASLVLSRRQKTNGTRQKKTQEKTNQQQSAFSFIERLRTFRSHLSATHLVKGMTMTTILQGDKKNVKGKQVIFVLMCAHRLAPRSGQANLYITWHPVQNVRR